MVRLKGAKEEEYTRILGHEPVLPVRGPRPIWLRIPFRGRPVLAWLIDVEALSRTPRGLGDVDRIISHLEHKTGVDRTLLTSYGARASASCATTVIRSLRRTNRWGSRSVQPWAAGG